MLKKNQKEYNEANKEKISAKKKEYRATNAEHIKEYKASHRDQINTCERARRAEKKLAKELESTLNKNIIV